MHTTTDASSFSSDEWAAWDAFLASSGEPSLHLSSGAVRASLRSPHRAVRVAVWRDDHDALVGIAVCEDSEAISQSVDDFLEGSRMFARAKAWLHRRGGLRFAVRVIGSPLASGPMARDLRQGSMSGAACKRCSSCQPSKPERRRQTPRSSRTSPLPNPGRAGTATLADPLGNEDGWTWNSTPSCGSI